MITSQISIGDIVQIVVVIIAAFGLAHRMGALETKVNAMWRHFLKVVDNE